MTPIQSAAPSEESVIAVGLRFLLTHYRSLLLWSVASAIAGTALSFAFSPRYTSEMQVSVAPSDLGAMASQSGLSSIASSFGLSLAGGNGYSPEFIAALTGSRDITDSVLNSAVRQPDGRTKLFQYIADDDSLTAKQYALIREKYLNRLSVNLDVRSEIVTITFWANDAAIARQVLDTLLSRINDKLIANERALARARRDYLASRVRESQAALDSAEDDLTRFHERNRALDNSPALQLESDRLARKVDASLQLTLDLRRQLDAAQLQILSNVPKLITVEAPDAPALKSFPHRKTWFVAFGILGVLGCIGRVTVLPRLKAAITLARANPSE